MRETKSQLTDVKDYYIGATYQAISKQTFFKNIRIESRLEKLIEQALKAKI